MDKWTNLERLDFKWESSPYKALREYLHIVNPTLGAKKLTPQEIEVLGAYVYLDYEYRHLPKETRNSILFSKTTKKKIINRLKTTNDAMNNIISSLYKKKFISKDKRLLIMIPFDGRSINISYKISMSDEKDEALLKTITNDEAMESTF